MHGLPPRQKLQNDNLPLDIDEAAFTSFLSRHFHRSYPSFAVAAPTLYKTARSHAAYPFTANPPETLSADSFLRAITMLTGRVRAVLDSPVKLSGVARGPDGTKSIETTLINPGRSERDVRRLVFQSIAVPAGKRDQAKQRSELIDDDLADVRIVASRAQPRPDYCYAPRPWKEFLPMAVRLSVPRPPLEDLHVPYEVLRELLKLLLAVQSSDQSAAAAEDAATLDSQAAALLRIAGSEGEDVGFEGFEKVYEGLGRREGLLENGMMEELRVPTPSGRLVLKPDMLQCLARVFEVFVAPDNEAWVKS
ncbi:hypothetical protein MMC13_001224 [Lambiella insularis]|nr:hypothetical protein [Lambiella insularis]